jgi:hypothetical protein
LADTPVATTAFQTQQTPPTPLPGVSLFSDNYNAHLSFY